MNNYFDRIPCVLMRGGTSKGLILRQIDLPNNANERDAVILRIYGSPDKRQIDGVGGGNPLTSKLAVIGPSSKHGVDINYTFGQVSLEKSEIDYKPTCGNMACAVGLYALEEGYVELVEPITPVRIFNSNTSKIIEAEIPVKDGKVQYEGNFSIDGVPGKAPCIMLNFLDSGGAVTGRLLPTENPKDTVTIDDGRRFDVSVIDSANVLVFVRAKQLNISGTEIDEQFNQAEILETLEKIRVQVGRQIGLIKDEKNVSPVSNALPKIAVVEEPQSYVSSTGSKIEKVEIELLGRYVAMGTLHQAFAVSGGIAVATAAKIPGTIISDIITNKESDIIHIGHPAGVITVKAEVNLCDGNYEVRKAAIGRTARRIMEGFSYVPTNLTS
jgi:2-methylaconitate cis-trans-isomerase PrpF